MSLEPIISWTPFDFYLNLDIGPTSEVGKRLIEDLEVLANAVNVVDCTKGVIIGFVMVEFIISVVDWLNESGAELQMLTSME